LVLTVLVGCFSSPSNDLRIRIPHQVDLSNFRSIDLSNSAFVSVLSQLFETLVLVDEQKRIVPALASRWDFDETYLYLDLKRGVYFHNGVELTSHYVVDSLGDLAIDMTSLVPVEEGPYRIRIPHLNRQFDVLSLLGSPEFSIRLDGVGTGPFRFSGYSASGSLILEKNPKYRIQGMPLVDVLEFSGSLPLDFQIQGYLRKEFHIVPVLSDEDRVVLEASGIGRFEIFGPYAFRVASELRNFSIYPSTGAYDFRRTTLVQEEGISP